MRLTELEPAWIEKEGRGIVGVKFLCPKCRHEIRIRIYFRNPADGGAPAMPGNTWIHSGSIFEDLSLFPSWNGQPGHAHFNVVNGEVVLDPTPPCREIP